MDEEDGMMTVKVPKDTSVLIMQATADGVVTKAADIAAAKAAAETKE
jgi:hypothetical protein